MRRTSALAALASLALFLGEPSAAFAARSCAAEDFGAAVDKAGATLRAVNLENASKLQSKISQLAKKNNWPDETREAKARDFLQDERISSLDATASELLARIDTLGRPQGTAQPDCAKLDDLEAAGVELLAVMKAKAAYTLDKIDAALGEGRKAAQSAQAKTDPPEAKSSEPVAPPKAARKDDRNGPNSAETRPSRTESGKEKEAVRPDISSWTTTSELDPSTARTPLPPPPSVDAAPDLPPPGIPYANAEDGYTIEEIQEVSRGFFGTISASLASVIEYAFSKSGKPAAYVLGTEGGGAFLAGVRYGSGKLFLHRGSTSSVYWTGPSLGYDFGAEGSRTMFLIYNLSEAEGLFRRFTGVDGSAYLVGGVGVTFLKGGDVIMAPIRSGLGLRLGANIGYIRFTPEPSWNPF